MVETCPGKHLARDSLQIQGEIHVTFVSKCLSKILAKVTLVF